MPTVYISSTDKDLQEHRRKLIEALSSVDYDVESMEKYPAREGRPKAECEKDAAAADVYVGVFAWRYGHIPAEDNPERRSITEFEYLAAGRAERARLVFLSAEDAAWPPPDLRDPPDTEAAKAIHAFRQTLASEKWFAYFRSADELTNKVLICLTQLNSMKKVGTIEGLDKIAAAEDLGSSFLGNIEKQIVALTSADFVCLRLGPTPWWDTRLHLLSALAADYTDIRQFIILDDKGRFVLMASPGELRRALAKAHPLFEKFYLRARELPHPPCGPEAQQIIFNYHYGLQVVFAEQMGAALGNQTASDLEKSVKQVMTPTSFRELGIRAEGEEVEQVPGQRQQAFYSSLLHRKKPFIAVMQSGQFQGVIDRADLASRMAVILQS